MRDQGNNFMRKFSCKLNSLLFFLLADFLRICFTTSKPESRSSFTRSKTNPSITAITKETATQRPRLTKAEQMCIYRKKLKLDPDRYREFCRKNSERVKAKRMTYTLEQKEKIKVLARKRQQRWRLKLKETKSHIHVTSKSVYTKKKTRHETEKQRAYWRERKRLQREKMSVQKKRRLKERDAAHKRVMKNEQNEKLSNSAKKAAIRKAVSRSNLPKDAESFADVLENIISCATPRKKAALRRKGIFELPEKTAKKKLKFCSLVVKNIRDRLQQLNGLTNDQLAERRIITSCVGKVLKKYRLFNTASKTLKLRRQYIKKCNQKGENLISRNFRKQRNDTTSVKIKCNIKRFYERCDISRELPTRKSVSVKQMIARKAMEMTIKRAYKNFIVMYPDDKVSLSVFSRLRPKHVKTIDYNNLEQCLCQRCQNIELKVKAINQFAIKLNVEVRLTDKYDVSQKTLCEPEAGKKYSNLSCIKRECDKCGTKLLYKFLVPLTKNKLSLTKSLSWHVWDQIISLDAMGKSVTRKAIIVRSGLISKLIEEASCELKEFSHHLFNASWQHQQFYLASNNVPPGTIIMVLDYGENYVCTHQDQTSTAHYNENVVTIHPIVVFYQCPKDCGSVTRDSLVFVSNDHIHDYNAVHYFISKAIEFLREDRKIKIKKIVKFSDGCCAQYKSKGPFLDISYSQKDFHCKTEHNYFGSQHGKGPADGETAVVKTAVRRAVKGHQALIQNAFDFFKYSKENMTINKEDGCCHSKRHFIFADRNSIVHNRCNRIAKTSITGTRKLHAVRSLGTYGVLDVRALSCYCMNCLYDNEEECTEKHFVLNWQKKKLAVQKKSNLETLVLHKKMSPIIKLLKKII